MAESESTEEKKKKKASSDPHSFKFQDTEHGHMC